MFMSRYFDRSKLLPVLLVAGVLLIIGLIVWATSGGRSLFPEPWKGVAGDPINVTLGFYEDWLLAKNTGPNEPFVQGLLDYEQVGAELKEKLKAQEGQLTDETTDPVLCQVGVPGGLRTLPVYQQEEAAQILVMSTTKGQAGQAIVDMVAKNGLWQITNITCGNAETGPQGEFSFDKSGFLLKQVPAPLDSNYWHLVYEEAGVLGHAVPLFMDAETVCVNAEGDTVGCDDNLLKETMPARVQGQMSEVGVEVKRIEVVETVSISD
ncbi:hypothetical protein COU14_02110 [Candidatus Kaiserbacteria bacterium CG10_big_fil_rev_8_21_14_0_10_44_10]|uniref:DUF3828 domain-containing protein n=1 Tax=Candidatus Kaiserbacteria bacterium CG10_big_fil_rev_8_21_14_0_10_44_10 TaxID=1974606 RepID=A0A2H0UHJ5_9BACT|nr:MAG: hypothetical protein COU14_02110 [Candidatus Kaiserbacteria bacterium CG10_big_fil_rev_8_21_14_0_10_44_10]